MVINHTLDYQIKNYVWAAREPSYEIMEKGMEFDEKGFMKEFQIKKIRVGDHRNRCQARTIRIL